MSLMVAQEVPTSTTVELPHGPTGVAEARRRLRTDLYARHVPEPVIDDAVLILSELLSNSCRHARPLGDPDDREGFKGREDRGDRAQGGGGATDRAGAQAPAARLADRSDRPGRAEASSGPHCPERTGRPGGADCAERRRAAARGDAGPANSTAAPGRSADRPDRQAGIRASWSVDEDGLLLLEVTDGGGPTRPRPSRPSLTAHGGRGLGIVGSLALRWGVRDAPGEVTVWVLLPVRGRHARRDDSLGTGIGLPMGVPLDLPLDLAESLDDMG